MPGQELKPQKAVLISIQPKWCELIASGKKTVEVRKTKPKIETPFKVYIYCTMSQKRTRIDWLDKALGGGMVIGEFVCDRVSPIAATAYGLVDVVDIDTTCLSVKELFAYSAGKLPLYGWHISNLQIYDEPKELSKFVMANTRHYCHVQRAPQSWCYVQEV